MLLELRIEDFAVIDRLTVRLGRGLNVLTGETGAGKSIIVDALALLLGERASSELVRPGAARAVVEGVFEIAGRTGIVELLAEQGIEPEDGLLILRREVAAAGRNRAWVNGAAATASLVGRVGRLLVDLHGQHEHQSLLRADAQRQILDAFAGAGELAQEVALAHAELRAAERELAALDQRARDAEQRSDFLRFQLREIDEAALEPGEDTRLQDELGRLEHAEELATIAEALHQQLYASDRSIADALAGARQELDKVLRIDRSEEPLRELLETAYYNVEEAGRRLGDYARGVEHDPARLDRLRRRQDLIFRLLRKYGPSIEDVLDTARSAGAELALIDDSETTRRDLDERVRAARAQLGQHATKLSAIRRKAARRLEGAVTRLLPGIALPEGTFTVRLVPGAHLTASGAEDVEFLVALNRGFESRPLARVASGGELSRIMLALRTVLARVEDVPSVVFDEIDAGVGGRVAQQVADRLKEVAAAHQVFAITHLAAIAARADTHLRVDKMPGPDGRAAAVIVPLDGNTRVAELARMLGGDAASAASLRHAESLIAQAR